MVAESCRRLLKLRLNSAFDFNVLVDALCTRLGKFDGKRKILCMVLFGTAVCVLNKYR